MKDKISNEELYVELRKQHRRMLATNTIVLMALVGISFGLLFHLGTLELTSVLWFAIMPVAALVIMVSTTNLIAGDGGFIASQFRDEPGEPADEAAKRLGVNE